VSRCREVSSQSNAFPPQPLKDLLRQKPSAQAHDQKTYLAGTVARALAVFCVDEVVVFDDGQKTSAKSTNPHATAEEASYTAVSDPCHFLSHVLSYLETPPYLRKALFPMHPNLRTAGTLPSLDMPHHSRAIEHCDYREGVTVESKVGSTNTGALVDVGLPTKRLLRDMQIPPHTRVTLKLERQSDNAEAVSPTAPREEAGYYWGYTVRRCNSLSAVFTESPFDGGYNVSFGTSERGGDVSEVPKVHPPPASPFHILVVFGGVAGLEAAAKVDHELQASGIDSSNVGDLFDHWVNVLPGQGSRTIRTEEAVWLGLMALRNVVKTDVT
jgi:predicted SPOUT superfamily RNA methylase MTH1